MLNAVVRKLPRKFQSLVWGPLLVVMETSSQNLLRISDIILVEYLYTAVLEEPSHTCSSYKNVLHNYKLKQVTFIIINFIKVCLPHHYLKNMNTKLRTQFLL